MTFMTDFLISRFIKNSQNTQDPVVREHYGILSGIVGIFCNSLLFVLKLLIGLVTHSISITADAFNNLSDGLSSVISIVGFKLSGKAPDADHPFGHGRTEYIAGFGVSFLILLVGIEFFKSSVSRILSPEPVYWNGVLMLILAASLLVKLWLGMFNRSLGKRIDSPTLLAAMQDSINDVISTSVVIIGILASRFTPLPIDGYIGVFVALFILWSGINIARDTLDPLLGQPADPKTVKAIQDIVLAMPNITGVHDMIVHNYGAGRALASLHAEVPDDANFVEIHEIVDEAEKQVFEQLGIFLVIHMDPVSINNERINSLHTQVEAVLHTLDERLSMHDFRVVDGQHRINLVFDVVIPFDYTASARDALQKNIQAALHTLDPRFTPVITYDHQM